MMLDSSLVKILSTKSVEPSISSNANTDNTPSATSTSEGTPIAAAKRDSETNPPRSEAEVRLVVRFLVEEHIVFNGKVEQVKHLDKTELSRIVSRIAWDGAKKDDQLTIENGNIVDNVENTRWLEENSELENCCDPTIEISPPQSHSPSPNQNSVDMIRPIEDGSTNVTEEPIYLTTNDSPSSPDEAVPSNEKGVKMDNQHLFENVKSNLDSECDNETTTFILRETRETTNQQAESSYAIHIDGIRHELQHDSQTLSEYDRHHQSTLEQKDEIDYSAIESQMIVDTINDCVFNVDLESRQDEKLNPSLVTERIKKETDEDIGHDLTEKLGLVKTVAVEPIKRVQHNETNNDATTMRVFDLDKKPLLEAVNIPPNKGSTRETIPNDSGVKYLRGEDAQKNEAGKIDLKPEMVPSKKTDNSGGCSTRRRNTNDISATSKRIRRVSSKNQQRTYRGSRIEENLMDRKDKSIHPGPVEDEDGGYFSCHSKILAKWSDNHFYPGTISKQKGDRKFEVIFYDGARKDVAETDLIPLCNILGRQVRISIAEGYCVNAVVLDQLSNNGQPMFDVEYQQNGLVKKRVPLVDIFLTSEQGIPLINQPIKPDKNPDESMFAGVDLDNIVHVKRSRRLQEMEDYEPTDEPLGNTSTTLNGSRRKRGQYNMRHFTNRVRTSSKAETVVVAGERVTKRSLSDVNNRDNTASSCSPDTLKINLDSSTSSSPSESSSSREANKF